MIVKSPSYWRSSGVRKPESHTDEIMQSIWHQTRSLLVTAESLDIIQLSETKNVFEVKSSLT